MQVNIKDLIEIYDKEIRVKCRNKNKLYIFERNKMQNINNIYNELINDSYYPSKYNIFIIKDPKYRIIMSLSIKDKIVNHYIARYILIPKLDKYLDTRIIATRKNYGAYYGIKLVKKYIEKNKKYGNFFILKIDIKKYFYNIDHDVLKELLKERLNEEEYKLLFRIIDSTNDDYINREIDKKKKLLIENGIDKNKVNDLPYYKYDKGLSLGAMVSQFLSIYYSHKLINYIVYKLKLVESVIYMDDIIIMHKDKNYLKESLSKIEKYLNNNLKLEINKKKTKIVSIKDEFIFLGYRFFVKNNKTIIKIKKDTLKRIKKRVKELNYLYNNNYIKFNKVFCSLNTYLYSFKYTSNFKVVKIVNKYFRVN